MYKVKVNKKIMFYIFVIIVIMAIFIINSTKLKSVSYLDFKQMILNNKISHVEIDSLDTKLKVTSNKGEVFNVENPKNEDFKLYLLENGIDVNEKRDNIPFITVATSIASLLVIIVFLSGTLNKSAGKEVTKTNVSLDDVVGIDEIKEDIVNAVDIFKNKNKIIEIGATPTKGIILYGDAGVGKTMLAKAIANYGDMNFISTSGSDFVELYAGMGARKVRKLFKIARKKKPCVVFIDEIDAIGGKRDADSNSERDQTINALLTELDGFDDNENILVICATNRIDILDEALIREGRFDRHFSIPLPNCNSRRQLILKNLENKKYDSSVDIDSMTNITYGMSGAKISTLINEAAINAYLKNRATITNEDIDASYSKITTNGVSVSHTNKHNIRVSAYHEAGHVLCSVVACKHEIYKVSIVANSSGFGGVTASYPRDLEKLQTKTDLINRVVRLYGGFVAEEIIFGEMSIGSQSDIAFATEEISDIVCEYGMGEYRMVYDQPNDDTLRQMEEISKEAYDVARNIIMENIDMLHKIAKILIDNGVIAKDEINDMLKRVKYMD